MQKTRSKNEKTNRTQEVKLQASALNEQYMFFSAIISNNVSYLFFLMMTQCQFVIIIKFFKTVFY